MRDLSAVDAAQRLLACALEQVAATPGGMPGNACVVWGDAVFANCCDGQLSVQVNRVFRSRNFPDQTVEDAYCNELFRVADLSIVVLRCAPQVNETGMFADCHTMTRYAAVADADADAIERAAVCCFAADEPAPTLAIGDRTSISTEGVCGGTILNVFVELERLCCA